jgi:hypothetical protein
VSTNPRYNDYLKEIEAQSGSAYDNYLAEIEGSAEPPKNKLGFLGKLKGATVAALKHVPFADEIGSALGATAALGPASFTNPILGATPREGGETYGEAYRRNLGEVEAERSEFAETNPVLSGIGSVAGFGASLAATAPMGVVKGAALMGGLQGASEAEGLGNRLGAGAAGAVLGAGIGKGADKLFKLGARKALTGLGAGVGATAGDSNPEHVAGAVGGAAAGAAGARLGGTAARKVLGSLRKVNPAQSMDDVALGRISEAARKEGITPEKIEAFAGRPGDIVADLGSKRGPIQRLTETAATYPTEGAKKLGDAIVPRAGFTMPAAEKSARRALGSKYKPQNPIAQQAKKEIAAEADPAFDALEGKVVSNPEVMKFLRSPQARDLYEEAQALAREEVEYGFKGASELPDLVSKAEDGTEVFATEIPAKAFHLMKRAVRSLAERRKNSPNPIDSDRAAMLGRKLSDVVKLARQDVPELGVADEVFGAATEKQVGKMAHRKQLADFAFGNSSTARRQKGQELLEGEGFDLADLNPKRLLARALKSETGKWLAGWSEELADGVARNLSTDVSTPAARKAFADQLRAQGVREEEVRRILSVLPRAAAGGVGIGAASLTRETKR